MSVKKDLAIMSAVFGFFSLLAGIGTSSFELGAIGVGALIFAACVGNIYLGDKAAENRARYISYKASKGVCDWCSGSIKGSYWSCSRCADVFCSERCYYEHKNNKHPPESNS